MLNYLFVTIVNLLVFLDKSFLRMAVDKYKTWNVYSGRQGSIDSKHQSNWRDYRDVVVTFNNLTLRFSTNIARGTVAVYADKYFSRMYSIVASV